MLVSNNPIENNADLLSKAQHLVDPTANSHTNLAINENITLPSNVSIATPKESKNYTPDESVRKTSDFSFKTKSALESVKDSTSTHDISTSNLSQPTTSIPSNNYSFGATSMPSIDFSNEPVERNYRGYSFGENATPTISR